MIELRNASYSYDGSRLVVDRVSLSLAPGERVVLLGLNGSGKSTLGRLLNGSLRPSEGSLSVDGESHDLARLVGYVRQDPRNQIVSAVVSDEVAFGPRNLGLSREEVLGRVGESLAACGIEGLRERMTSELSGGQQQLVSLAGVLAIHPRYVVLDEASSMLDRGMRRRVAGVVESLVARGVGVIEIAHSAEALSGASRILVMDEGRLVWEGEELPTGLAERLFGRPGPVPTSQGAADASAHSLEARGVTLAYDELVALDDVSLVSRGLTLLVGASGSGKTTLAKVMAGVLRPDAGAALLDGSAVRAGSVGLAFQRSEDQLFCDTVLEDIAFGPRAAGLPDDAALASAREAARMLGVDEGLFERSPLALSGGQMRRVALAGVVSGSPAAYVLDEPTAGLDAPSRLQLRTLVRDLVHEGASVLVITHDPEEWLPLADSVAFLRGGRVTALVHAREAAARPDLYRDAGLEPPLIVSPSEVRHA